MSLSGIRWVWRGREGWWIPLGEVFPVGLGTILESLREESRKANEEKRNLVKRKGEEAGTKLLFPMILLLGIVMVLILVPAVFTFQKD